jgi:YVTN family beta-propeller protein
VHAVHRRDPRFANKVLTAVFVVFGNGKPWFATVIALAALGAGPFAHAQNVTNVPVGNDPGQVVVNSATNTIYTLNVGDGTSGSVSVVNGATNAVTATVPVTGFLQSIAVNPVTNRVYVVADLVSLSNGTVTVIDGGSNVVATIPVGINAGSIAVNTVTNQIYVVTSASNVITMIDGATNTTSLIPTDILPTTIAVDEATNTIWYGNGPIDNTLVTEVGPNGTVDVPVSTDTTITTSPLAIAVNPLTDLIYVVNQTEKPGAANFLSVIDGTLNTPTVTVPLDTTQVTIEADDAVVVNQATNTIYVTNSASKNVTVLNGATNVATTVGVGNVPGPLALNAVTNQVYVANVGDGTVSVIDGAKNVVTATVPVGSAPTSVAVNPVTNRIYVANSGSNSLSVIGGSGGLPAPTPTPTPTPTPPPTGGGGVGGGGSGSARLINISTRAEVGTGGNILISGFVINGSGTETLLIRADGPSLATFGVTGVLTTPSMSVFDNSGKVIASNTGWGTNANPAAIASAAVTAGAFALPSNSADCAILATLPAGAYTVQVSGVNNTTGVALAEVYEISASGTRLVNISTRSGVGTGAGILISGFVISGTGSEQLLVRGDGPSLAAFGVTGVLANPSLSIFNNAGAVIASNTGWGTSSNPALIASTATQVGAYALPSGSADSAQILSLPAGAYTVQITGVNQTTGIALAEVYEVH